MSDIKTDVPMDYCVECFREYMRRPRPQHWSSRSFPEDYGGVLDHFMVLSLGKEIESTEAKDYAYARMTLLLDHAYQCEHGCMACKSLVKPEIRESPKWKTSVPTKETEAMLALYDGAATFSKTVTLQELDRWMKVLRDFSDLDARIMDYEDMSGKQMPEKKFWSITRKASKPWTKLWQEKMESLP